jgi:hypothetical protein
LIAPDEPADDYAIVKVIKNPIQTWTSNHNTGSVFNIDIIVYCGSNIDDLEDYVEDINDLLISQTLTNTDIKIGNIRLQSEFYNFVESDQKWTANVLISANVENI